MNNNLTSKLSEQGYWPAKAKEYLDKREYSKAIVLCTSQLKDEPNILSGRIVLAQALYFTNQLNEAESQFYRILQIDPDNILALKFLGDLKFRAGDSIVAFSFYERVLRLDKYSRGICLSLENQKSEKAKEITLLTFQKKGETIASTRERLRQIPFDTETAGDLLLEQGHARMAGRIYQKLYDENESPRLLEKLEQIRKMGNQSSSQNSNKE